MVNEARLVVHPVLKLGHILRTHLNKCALITSHTSPLITKADEKVNLKAADTSLTC